MYKLDELNDTQKMIVLDTDGAILVSAGAGSGKTRLLTHRVAYLILEKKVSPNNILAITFTNKATNEMSERIASMANGANVWISTFHSMCAKILRENIGNLNGYNKYFTIYDSSDRDKILKMLIKESGENDSELKGKLDYHISNAKNNALTPNEYRAECAYYKECNVICDLYEKYEQTLKENNALDFDDLLLKTYQLFNVCPQVLQYYQNLFQYILVDEFQDTNVVQYKILKQISAHYGNIFVVGDEDQSIYGWRGASIENIKNFVNDFDNVKIYKLEQNYRSTKNILNTANMLIKHNTARIDKTLFTDNDSGEIITYNATYDDKEEGEFVSRTIANLHSNGVPYHNIGILMRINAISRIFEEKLLNYNIPYIVSGGFKFFERLEIKNILAYLSVVVNNQDSNSCLRIINYPKRGIGDASIERLKEVARENNISIPQLLLKLENYDLGKTTSKFESFANVLKGLCLAYENSTLVEFIDILLKTTGIDTMYNNGSEEDENRRRNVMEFVNSVREYDNNNDGATITDYLQSVTLQTSLSEDLPNDRCVNISTIHAAKGLEFDYVFVVGCEEGIFPLSRCCDNESEVEEERRLMYVAITRAKKKLYITRAKSRYLYSDRGYTAESRFITEMKLSLPKADNVNTSLFNNSAYSYGYQKPQKTFVNTSFTDYVARDKDEGSTLYQSKISGQKGKFDEYKIGVQVLHPKFGIGDIVSVETVDTNTFVTVSFKGVGNKTLSLNFAPLQILKTK